MTTPLTDHRSRAEQDGDADVSSNVRIQLNDYGSIGGEQDAPIWASNWRLRTASMTALVALTTCLLLVSDQTFSSWPDNTPKDQSGQVVGKGGEELSEEKLYFDVRGRVVLPAAFDVRWHHAECRGFEPISIPPDQPCNTAYAILTAAALSARACIESNGEWNFLLSAQNIIDCYPGGDGCVGSVEGALELMVAEPGLESVCHALDGGAEPALERCGKDDCHGSLRYRLRGQPGHATASFSREVEVLEGAAGSGASVLRLDGREAVPQSVSPLKLAVLEHGPCVGKLNTYSDSTLGIRPDPLRPPISPFPDSPSAIYTGPGNVDADAPDGTREVLVLGWGSDPDSGREYWVVQDTLGECYGDKGSFKVAMGGNVNNLEGYGFRYGEVDLRRALMDKGKATFLSHCDEALEAGGVCLNGGVMSDNGCRCVCPGRWGGARCEKCLLDCANGGVLNDFVLLGAGDKEVHKCACDCPEGLAGLQCAAQCPNARSQFAVADIDV